MESDSGRRRRGDGYFFYGALRLPNRTRKICIARASTGLLRELSSETA